MQKKLTITVQQDTYDGLYRVVGARHISRFIEDLVTPHLAPAPVKEGWAALAAYERETGLDQEALDWSEALLESLADDQG